MSLNPTVCLKSIYPGDPQASKAGEGLVCLPVLGKELSHIILSDWLMSLAEQMAMIYLLERLRPRASIEIGTRFGGSLQVLAALSEKVYSLDIDPDVTTRLAGKHSNVEYLIGPSHVTAPLLIERLNKTSEAVSFVLIDGDHSAEGVRRDIENILKIRPTVPLFIVLHDSYNPECRRGMVSANWADCPYVHLVELDFVPGSLNSCDYRGELWGGLGLAVLLPEKRSGRFEVTGKNNLTVRALGTVHNRTVFHKRLRASISYHWGKFKGATTSSKLQT